MFGSQIASTNRGDLSWREVVWLVACAMCRFSDDLPVADVINRVLLLGDMCAEERVDLITAASDDVRGLRKTWCREKSKEVQESTDTPPSLRPQVLGARGRALEQAQNRILPQRARTLPFFYTHTFITKWTVQLGFLSFVVILHIIICRFAA